MFIGDESIAAQLRLLTAAELFIHADFYSSHPHLSKAAAPHEPASFDESTVFTMMLSDTSVAYYSQVDDRRRAVEYEAQLVCQDKNWSVMLVVLGLASVVGTDMLSIYPDVGEELSKIVHGAIAPRHKHNLFLGKKVSIMWSRYGNFDNRPGAVFEPNHFVAMKQCSPVNSPTNSRKGSFAGSPAVVGKSKKKTQRRIDSFRFFIPRPMTVKEETGDGRTETTEQTPTTRQQEETHSEPQLNHRPPTEHEEPNSQPRLADFGLGFLHTSRGPFVSPGDNLESRSLSSEASRLHGLIAGGGCITLKTKTR